jgi:single-stranded DNA-binding protein
MKKKGDQIIEGRWKQERWKQEQGSLTIGFCWCSSQVLSLQ